MVDLDFLEKVEVFQDLNDEQLTAVGRNCETAECKRGDKIFSAGKTPRYLWVVRKGEVDLQWESASRSGQAQNRITRLTPPSVFGWSSLVPPHKYTLSAECASRNCELVKIARNVLVDLFENDTSIGYRVMNRLLTIVAVRFLELQEEIAHLRGSDIINRW